LEVKGTAQGIYINQTQQESENEVSEESIYAIDSYPGGVDGGEGE